jgi:hypothetical protein
LPYHLNHWIDNSSFYGTQQSKYLSPIIWGWKQIQLPKWSVF